MLRCLVLLAWLISGWTAAAQDDGPETPDRDPVLTRARQAAVDTSEKLVKFLCDKHTVRLHRDTATSPWQNRDVIDAEIAFDRGSGEGYRNVTVNGVPTPSNVLDRKGSNSLGEFALDLRNLFDSIGSDSFHLVRVERQQNQRLVRIYSYAVEQSASNWKVEENSQSTTAAFVGTISIDVEAGQVVRLEMRACNLPEKFPESLVSTVVNYGPVTIASQQPRYLPIGAEVVFCSVEGTCDRNEIHFDHYRQFTAESTLLFTPPPAVVAPALVPPPASLSLPAPWNPSAVHFVGVAHPRTSTTLALELDDERVSVCSPESLDFVPPTRRRPHPALDRRIR